MTYGGQGVEPEGRWVPPKRVLNPVGEVGRSLLLGRWVPPKLGTTLVPHQVIYHRWGPARATRREAGRERERVTQAEHSRRTHSHVGHLRSSGTSATSPPHPDRGSGGKRGHWRCVGGATNINPARVGRTTASYLRSFWPFCSWIPSAALCRLGIETRCASAGHPTCCT